MDVFQPVCVLRRRVEGVRELAVKPLPRLVCADSPVEKEDCFSVDDGFIFLIGCSFLAVMDRCCFVPACSCSSEPGSAPHGGAEVSRCGGVSCGRVRAIGCSGFSSWRLGAQYLWPLGLVALWPGGSSLAGD